MDEMKTEVLSMAELDADSLARAKRREARCEMTPEEQELFEYAPNRARGNTRPGYPDSDYGEMNTGD